jgi:hypothetical protein
VKAYVEASLDWMKRQRPCAPSERWYLFASRHEGTSQKTGIFITPLWESQTTHYRIIVIFKSDGGENNELFDLGL